MMKPAQHMTQVTGYIIGDFVEYFDEHADIVANALQYYQQRDRLGRRIVGFPVSQFNDRHYTLIVQHGIMTTLVDKRA
jgi:hypothetical protein